MKDTNNNVIRISGIGNISDDGLTEVPSDNVAPPNPVSGNLWFNADEGRLYIYYVDDNSEQWVDASPDNWSASILPDITDPNEQPGSLDGRYVSKVATTSQDMAGDLTFDTDKITLDASGAATFASGECSINKDGAVAVNKATYGTAFGIAQAGVSKAFIQSDGDSYFNQAVKVGNTYADPNIKLLANGSANFSANVDVGTPNSTTDGGSRVSHVGQIVANAADPTYKTFISKVLNQEKIAFLGNGSAEFAGKVKAGSFDLESLPELL
jgi:peroxiredoxin